MPQDPQERRDNRIDKLNIPNVYEHGDVDFEIDPELLGWIPHTDDVKKELFAAYSIDFLGLATPLTVEKSLPFPSRVDGQDVINAYDQVGGTCGGASSAQATTGRHELRQPGAGKLFDYMGIYCHTRQVMGDTGPCNINQGVTMQALGKTLKNWGAPQIIGGKVQPVQIENGVASYSWGYNADAIRTGISNGIYVQIGIAIYQAFQSPKKFINPINGKEEYMVYWQDGSWGSFLGGHAMTTWTWSDQLDAFYLWNTWGYGFPKTWMSRKAFTRLLTAAMPAEIMLCVDRPTGPVGKIELAEPFTIVPNPAKTGDKIIAHLAVKNTGDGVAKGVKFAIEDMVDSVGKDGFGFTPEMDLQPGGTYGYSPERPDALTAGHWRFRGDYAQYGVYHVLGTVEMDVEDNPEPPPPPPEEDTLTISETLTIDGVKYTTEVDQPDGVIYRKVP
jgi:hypothetical protein